MDPFQQVADWDEETARRWAEGLDHRAADPQQVALRAGVVAAADLRPGDLVVEVGSGTGPLLAALAAVVGPGGQVLGVEPQPTLARIAADRLGDRAGVCLGVGDRLPVRSGVAAAVVAQTVEVAALTHVDTEPGSHLHGNALRVAGAAVDAGFFTPAEADRWTAGLVEDCFFAALTYYRCTGTVPA
jgi:SAM-dependent methyltransferase